MGFRQGAYARIWSVNDEGKYSTANVSVSRKNKETGNYDVEFSDGYVRLVGTAHEDVKNLGLPTREEFDSKKDKGVSIRISSCDVTNNYDQKTKKLYTNCVIFGFEIPDGNSNSGSSSNSDSSNKAKKSTNSKAKTKAKTKKTDEDDSDIYEDEDDLPF